LSMMAHHGKFCARAGAVVKIVATKNSDGAMTLQAMHL
jgi:hypothetical protein